MVKYADRYCMRIKMLLFCWLIGSQYNGFAQHDKSQDLPFRYVRMDSSNEWITAAFDQRIVDSIHIVGLGEVTHGAQQTSTINVAVVKYLIGKRGFRQLLFEYPNAPLSILNYYLTEEKFKNIDTLNLLTAEARAGSVTDRSFFELMQWLKQFNLMHPKDMVQLKGFDISGAGRSFVNYFRSNFNTLLDSTTKLNVDRAMREMSNIDHAAQLIIKWFYKNQDTVQRRLKKYYPDLLYNVHNAAWAQQHIERQKANFYGASAFRDSVMAININELSSLAKTIVWTHNLHVTTADNAVSMGNYLRKLRSDYYTIITDFTRSGKVYIATKSNELAIKSVLPSKETVAYKLADKYKLSAGVVFYNDLIRVKKIGVLFNSIDRLGNNIILGKGHGFDAMILLDLLTAAEPFSPDIQRPVTKK